MWFQWLMRVLMLVAVAFGFATVAYQTRRFRKTSYENLKFVGFGDEIKNFRTLLIATWLAVILLALIAIIEMVYASGLAQVIIGVIETIVWIAIIIYMFIK